MKKIISLALVCVMMLGMLSMVSFADEPVELKIVSKFGGWENWKNSKNNPTPGAEPGVTQLLIGATATDGTKIPALFTTEATWTITFTWFDGTTKTKTIELKPGSTGIDYDLIRFETCIAEGDNQFIPDKNQRYTIEVSTTIEGVKYHGKSAKNEFSVPMHPVVNGAVDTTREYTFTYPTSPDVDEYFKGDETTYKSDWENGLLLIKFVGDAFLVSDLADGTKVVVNIDGTEYNGTIKSTYAFSADNVILRLDIPEFEPTEGTKYSVSVKVYGAEDKLLYTSKTSNTITYGEVAKPAEPDTPATGDNAVVAIVFATVAILGMAVVVTKKVNA